MSGTEDDLPPGPEDRNALLAGEYVLGTLDPVAAEQAARDPDVAAEIVRWERRLAPLLRLVAPVAPPAIVWTRIAFSTGLDIPAAQPPARESGKIRFWQVTTAAATTLAVALAALALIGRPAAPPAVIAALSPTGAPAAAFIAERDGSGGVSFRPLHPVQVAAGRDLELWVLGAAEHTPRSLGILPPTGRAIARAALPTGKLQLMVSLEPRGGSPTGQPTGPVLYAGSADLTD